MPYEGRAMEVTKTRKRSQTNECSKSLACLFQTVNSYKYSMYGMVHHHLTYIYPIHNTPGLVLPTTKKGILETSVGLSESLSEEISKCQCSYTPLSSSWSSGPVSLMRLLDFCRFLRYLRPYISATGDLLHDFKPSFHLQR